MLIINNLLWSFYSPQPSRPRKAKRQTRLLGQTQGSTCRFKVLRSFKYLKMPPGIKHLKYQISRNITWQSDSGRPSPWLRTQWNPHLRNVNVCHLFIFRPHQIQSGENIIQQKLFDTRRVIFGLTLLLLLVHRRQVAALKFGLQKQHLVGFESEVNEYKPDRCRVDQRRVPPKMCPACLAPTWCMLQA